MKVKHFITFSIMNFSKTDHDSFLETADLFHMRSQPLFHTEKLEKNLFLAFEIESIMMICRNLFLYSNL